MAIQMTRAEYERLYGASPVIPSTSSIDTTPAPIRMTQEEYDEQYGLKQPKTRVGNFLSNTKNQVVGAAQEGIAKTKAGFEQAQNATTLKEGARGRLRLASGAVDIAFAPLAPIFAPIGNLVNKAADKISDIPSVQKFANSPAGEKAITTAEDIYDINNVAGLFVGGKTTKTAIPKVKAKFMTVAEQLKENRVAKSSAKIENELLSIENSYNKTSELNARLDDTGNASRQRIAKTDVLSSIVDEDGKITFESAKNAAKAYEQQTIAGAEGVVRDLLKNENKTISVQEVRKILTQEVALSGLEGADLMSAIRGIESEIKGLSVRGDGLGNLPLYKIHDAKISTTRNIDFTKPPEVSYRRSLAKAYKQIVENKSNTNVQVFGKNYSVKEINAKLAEFYGDIERIERLGGKRVKGGRLGKYSAQITGNAVGAVAGAPFGPAGMAISTIVGGEVASRLRGKQMASTFGKAKGKLAAKSDLLDAAKKLASEGKRDLTIPDVSVGVAKGIPKTKEIIKVESQIKKNVADQKKAIKKGDFTLVATLKDVYVALVERLKDLVKEYKEIYKKTKEGGYIANPFASKSGKQPEIKKVKSSPSTKTTTKDNISQDLIQEAKKYKSADEFVEAQPVETKTLDGAMGHRPTKTGATADNISQEVSDMGIPDFYEHPEWYHYGGKEYDESVAALKKIKGKPNEEITIYRAAPKNELRTGDWVTLSKEKAKLESLSENVPIQSFKVKVSDVEFAGDDITEFGYWGHSTKTKSQLTDIWNKANQKQ